MSQSIPIGTKRIKTIIVTYKYISMKQKREIISDADIMGNVMSQKIRRMLGHTRATKGKVGKPNFEGGGNLAGRRNNINI